MCWLKLAINITLVGAFRLLMCTLIVFCYINRDRQREEDVNRRDQPRGF